MKFGLPTTIDERATFDCADLQHGYMLLTVNQKKQWLRAAAGGGVLKLSQPMDNIDGMQINIYNSATGKCNGLNCLWLDRDIF